MVTKNKKNNGLGNKSPSSPGKQSRREFLATNLGRALVLAGAASLSKEAFAGHHVNELRTFRHENLERHWNYSQPGTGHVNEPHHTNTDDPTHFNFFDHENSQSHTNSDGGIHTNSTAHMNFNSGGCHTNSLTHTNQTPSHMNAAIHTNY